MNGFVSKSIASLFLTFAISITSYASSVCAVGEEPCSNSGMESCSGNCCDSNGVTHQYSCTSCLGQDGGNTGCSW